MTVMRKLDESVMRQPPSNIDAEQALIGAVMLTPRYERGVDTSRKIAGVPDDRAESLHLIDGVKARIGEEMFAILFHRVINGHSFSWMASQGMGESERLGVLFLAAIDATARHFGLRERSRAVEAMEQQVSA